MRSSSVCFLFPCCFSFICSFPWRLVRRLVGRLVIPSRLVRPVLCRVVRRAVLPVRLVGSSRLVVSYGRRSVLLVARSCSPIRSRFMSSVVGRGCASWAWGGRGGALFSSVSSVPSFAPTRYSFARCWMDTVMGGYGAPFHVARRSSIACSCRIVHPISSGFPSLPFVSSSPHPKQKKRTRRKPGRRRKGIKRDAPRDEDTRRRHETPSDENGRTTTKGNWAVPLFKQAHNTNETRRKEIPFIISPDPLSPAPLSSASLILSPAPGRGISKQNADLPGYGHEMMSGRRRFNRAAHSAPARSLFPCSSVPRIAAAAYPAPFSLAHSPVRSLILLPRRRHSFSPRVIIASLSSRLSSRPGAEWGGAKSSVSCRPLVVGKQAGGRGGGGGVVHVVHVVRVLISWRSRRAGSSHRLIISSSHPSG